MPPTPTVISAQPLENTVRGYLERNDLIGLKPFLATQWAPDIADVLERLPGAQRDLAFTQLDPPLAAGVLAEVGTENKRDLLRLLSRDQLTKLLSHLPMDDVTRLIVDAPERSEEVLADLKPAVAQEVRNNLQYPKESAGRLMTEKFVTVTPQMTAQEALVHLREVHRDAETFSDIYAVDDDDHLEGVTSLRDLIIARPEQRLREFMVKDVVSVAPTDDQEVAARLIAHYNFLALPVTRDGRILVVIKK